MKRYYISQNSGDIHERVEKLRELVKESQSAVDEFISEYNVVEYFPSSGCVSDGIGGVKSFNNDINENIWKKHRTGEYYIPRMDTKEGREIIIKLRNMPKLSWQKFNRILIDWDRADKLVGLRETNDGKQLGIEVADDWDVCVPTGFSQVSEGQFKKLFGIR